MAVTRRLAWRRELLAQSKVPPVVHSRPRPASGKYKRNQVSSGQRSL